MRPCKNACGRNTLKLDVCAECRASEGDYIGTGQGQKPNGKVCKECAGQSWRRPVGRPCSCGGAYSEDQSMRRR